MRLMIHEYANGGRIAFELTDDGADVLAELDGKEQLGQRICAFVDAACDSNDKGYDRLLEALTWAVEEVKKRKTKAGAA
jgi:hypothetical protein